MNRTARRWWPSATVVVMILAACLGCSAGSGDGKPLIIGYVAARVGFGAVGDVDGVDGARYEIDRLNRTGGIDGHHVELIVEDMGTDTNRSGDIARRLIDRGATVLLGPPFPFEARGAIDVAAQAGIPILSVTSTQPSFVAGHEGQTYLTAFGDNAQGAAAAEQAYADGKRRAFTITSPDVADYTDAVPRYFQDAFTHAGGATVGTVDIHLTADEYKRAAAAVGASSPQPDVVYTTIYPPDLAPLLHELRTAGYHGSVYSSDASDNAGVFAIEPTDAEGLVVTTHGYPEAPRSGLLFSPRTPAGRVADFKDGFTRWTGHAPTAVGLAALGADSIDVIRAAVERGHSITPADIAANIGQLERADVTTGRVTFLGQRGIPRKVIYLLQVQSGRFRLLRAMEPDYIPTAAPPPG